MYRRIEYDRGWVTEYKKCLETGEIIKSLNMAGVGCQQTSLEYGSGNHLFCNRQTLHHYIHIIINFLGISVPIDTLI